MTANDGPSAWRSAMASVRPAKPPPAISTSVASRDMALFYHAGSGLDDGRRTTDDGRRIRKYPSVVCRPSSVVWSPHALRRSGSPRHSRSRAAGGEPVPRPLAAIALAAGVRRPGDRPGAGRRLPHRRRTSPRGRRIRCTPISCSAAIPKCRSSTRSTASATARVSPRATSRRSSTATPSSRCRCRSTSPSRASTHQVKMPDVPKPDAIAERRGAQGPHLCR